MTTILVVDDNEKIVEVLAEYLRADGYSAST
ncbi:MAG: response regulator transcription factor, partial [Actinobacteria bacterium]